ncbi:MAG TPA: TIGR03808 family TAT-translocated repetitive protein [Pseudolabrys sp.]|nr:TIGR03808 family TAT-translocated repetitive protein [Pseudolabrys sp.]
MRFDRRSFLTAAAAALATPAAAAPLSRFGLDATTLGVRPGAPDDQSRALQRAIDRAAKVRLPLVLAPGVYRAGDLKLPAGASLVGVQGATRLVFTHGRSLVSAEHADTVSLEGLILDGKGQTIADGRGLAQMNDVQMLRIDGCEVIDAGGNGIVLDGCDGEVTHTTISKAADTALFSRNGRGLLVVGNIIRGAGNGGIRVWQSEKKPDGSTIADNRIEETTARAGGSGQNGNAINVFRAGNIIVRNNHIRGAAFSAIRGNSAANIQILGNNCSALDEVAIYSEFGFQGAIIADNIVDGAGIGVSVTNFNEGGRLATVRGNIIRNLAARRPGTPPEDEGVGISVEADTAVTGNVIENAATAGISAGWGRYLRDVAITGNIVRVTDYGIALSVTAGAGSAVVTGNLVSGARRGAVVGVEYRKAVTGDLARGATNPYPQLKIADNQVS